MAKILVVAPDRARAIARARRALGELDTAGVQTTLPFHAWLLVHPAFVEGRLRTDLVDTDWDPGPLREAAERRAAELVAAAWPSLSATREPPELARSQHGWALAARREAVARWDR